MSIFTDAEAGRRHFFQSCSLPPEPTAEQIRKKVEQFRAWEKLLAPLPDKLYQEILNLSARRDTLVVTTLELAMHTRFRVSSLQRLKIDLQIFCRRAYCVACLVIAGENLSEVRKRNNLFITLLEEEREFLKRKRSYFVALKETTSMFTNGLEKVLKEPPFSSSETEAL